MAKRIQDIVIRCCFVWAGASQLPKATGAKQVVWGGVSRYMAMIKMMETQQLSLEPGAKVLQRHSEMIPLKSFEHVENVST